MSVPDKLPSQMIEHGRFVCPGDPMPVIDAGSPEMAREIVFRWNAYDNPDPIIHAHGMGQEGAMRDAAEWLTKRGLADLGTALLAEFGIPASVLNNLPAPRTIDQIPPEPTNDEDDRPDAYEVWNAGGTPDEVNNA